ncbi:integral membrane protein [Colletotrichum tofieldiae]|nr:integral membrane protein [Colletotrichum tofieldiae]
MIRTPYIDNYNRPLDDLAFHIANIPLWSNVETALIESYNSRYGRLRWNPSSVSWTRYHRWLGGTSKIKARKGLKSNFEIDEAEQGDWTRLDEDNVSDKESTVPIRGIRRETTFEVEMSSFPGHKQ